MYDNPVNPVWDILTGGDFYDWSQYLIGWYGNPGPIPLLLRRVDSDTSWEVIYSFIPAPNIPEDITSVDEKIFVCCWQGKIYNSTDGGNNWIEQSTETGEDLSAISFYNNLIGYSVGKNGTILFTSNGGVTSIEENQEITEYNLNQNYPNPFNPTTIISYQLAVGSHILLKVFDLLGKEVMTLVNEYKPAGFYTIDFKGSNLPSGIYFYKLQAGNYIETRKMVLTK
ncbi:MAG: T9SS type A sorting domain-containing protein [Ignavibacteria bacterium]|nr:T9SS type A sorting domain-containing protein [Ignavibacteria bacterium]